MRVPLTWLREYVSPELDAQGIAERLDLTGTELERLEHVGVGSVDGFVVGKVLSAEQHPDADRLRVCTVDDGSGSERTIVCGAPNVAAGQTVAVALPGAVMPDGTKLGKAKLRGVESAGMICAEDELGIGGDHTGIVVLSDEFAPGTPLTEALPIFDEVLDLEITPNRPDCLSVYGMAREVHAATGAPLAEDPSEADAEPGPIAAVEDSVTVTISDPDACLRYTARAYEDVTIGPSPAWLRQRLTAAGQRPINNVVDISNYVMLTCGQPIHIFDLDAIRGGRIDVRRSRAGERLKTLDGVDRELGDGAILICDGEGPVALGGVMGGEDSEVGEGTTRVLVEAATFDGPSVLKTSKAQNLRSEASTRLEKQLHPENTLAAQRLTARLMVELCGATLAPGTADAYPEPKPSRVLALRPARVERILGTRIESEELVRILESLGFGCDLVGEQIDVAVPYWRDADVQREIDLIEEVARIHGLDRLPVTLPARKNAVGRLTPRQLLRRRVEDSLRDRGLDEVLGWSFTSPETVDKLRLADEPVLALDNPLSEDQSVMRPLLLPGLLDAARDNLARAASSVALFESAHVYLPDRPLEQVPEGSPRGVLPAAETHHLAGLLAGARGGTWRTKAAAPDFYAAKGLVEAIVSVAGVEVAFAPGSRPYLHPGRTAVVSAGDTELGWVGELHPSVASEWDLSGAAAFELDFDALAVRAPKQIVFADLTSFPAVRQDIAVVAPRTVTAGEVRSTVLAAGGKLLREAEVFDVYEGEKIGAEERSLALALEFRAPDRTLTDEEVDARRAKIETALADIGGRLRG